MSETCETVEIVSDNETGFKVINKSDLSKDDVIYDADKIEADAEKKRLADIEADEKRLADEVAKQAKADKAKSNKKSK